MSWSAWAAVFMFFAALGLLTAYGLDQSKAPPPADRKVTHRLDWYPRRPSVDFNRVQGVGFEAAQARAQQAQLRDALIGYLDRAQPGDREVVAVAAAVLAQEGGM
ncbi:MAG: hypothetical protein QGI83_00780 [Candidatus Latescibacteria bacterium]|jgi:hypothetical protein|nr:hypothetical protein [Candidatus Latescibacterota bacterium]